jgi:hypothetical protein
MDEADTQINTQIEESLLANPETAEMRVGDEFSQTATRPDEVLDGQTAPEPEEDAPFFNVFANSIKQNSDLFDSDGTCCARVMQLIL